MSNVPDHYEEPPDVRSGDTHLHEQPCGCMFCQEKRDEEYKQMEDQSKELPGDIIRQAWVLCDGYEWNERKVYLDHFMCEQSTDLLSVLRGVLRAQGELTGIIDQAHVSPLEGE
jgi:hypothetical protein